MQLICNKSKNFAFIHKNVTDCSETINGDNAGLKTVNMTPNRL